MVGRGPPGNLVAGLDGTSEDFGHPTYYSKPADPLFTLHCTQREWGRCDLEDRRIRIPDAARPAAGADGHMTVVDGGTGFEYDFWRVSSKPAGGGRLEMAWGGRTRIDGDGLASDATAARFGNLAGIIRAQELQAGRIEHALFMTINCDNGGYVYPALKSSRPCSSVGSTVVNAAPLGARFRLDMSRREIDVMGLPRWKKAIFLAMARYGMFFGDSGGPAWGIQVESDATYTSFGRPGRFLEFARRNGFTPFEDPNLGGRTVYVGSFRHDVDWGRRLQLIHPCVSEGSVCPD